MANKKKSLKDLSVLGGLVYSTEPISSSNQEEDSFELVPYNQQKITVGRSSKGRGGKVVTEVYGFELPDSEIEKIAKELKTLCGTGGSAKNGEILIQGENRQKVADFLTKKGFKTKISG